MNPHYKHIIFIDGECLICHRTSQIIHRLDHRKNIYFSTLQGKTADILPSEWLTLSSDEGDPSGSVVFAECLGNGEYRFWIGANAMLRSLLLTKSIASPLWIFYYTPPVLKNLIYRQVAKNRHRLSSKIKNCPIPPQSFNDALLP